jgi:aryl-alcohol dehydrogenase-like predicted oxidoreductase
MCAASPEPCHRSPNILLIPGTSSVAHPRENLAAADLDQSADALADWTKSAPETRGDGVSL